MKIFPIDIIFVLCYKLNMRIAFILLIKGSEKMIQKNILKAKMVLEEKTQPQIAKVLGLSLPSVSKKINGVTKFSIEEIKKLRKYLNLTTEEVEEIFLS